MEGKQSYLHDTNSDDPRRSVVDCTQALLHELLHSSVHINAGAR